MASENKPSAREAAQSFISNLASRQFAPLGDLFAADGTYWVSGEKPKVPWAGSMPASERLPQLPAMHGNFTSFSIDEKAFVAEGRRAVVELSVHGIDSAGGRYDNDVVMIFEVNEDGKIVALREYLDNMQPLAYFASKNQSGDDVLGLDSNIGKTLYLNGSLR
ncbi:unnamed protein product [Clonostachys chloroleuca]|uniref:SnoaL-like domain-containing protein n=1 Tax=Clonostachys chloroleuca TaxID=1926264 RepID=A0AA35M8P9_9HYPO|nr:unnamed protein product [Clonostachys chloroleuca]